MAQIKCKNGHFYNNEIYEKCPYCPDDPEVITPPKSLESPETSDTSDTPKSSEISEIPKSTTKPKSTINIMAIISVVVAITSFFLVNSKEQELIKVQQELNEQENALIKLDEEIKTEGSKLNNSKLLVDNFNSLYGHGSEDFYTDTPVLILNADGDSKTLTIHGNFRKTVQMMNYVVNSEFTKNWSNDLTLEWVGDDIKVTSGATKGYNILHFFNDDNDATFDILVIVK